MVHSVSGANIVNAESASAIGQWGNGNVIGNGNEGVATIGTWQTNVPADSKWESGSLGSSPHQAQVKRTKCIFSNT
jgi:hypothetical protein